eukprot:5256046-Amphidinium_carterae.1
MTAGGTRGDRERGGGAPEALDWVDWACCVLRLGKASRAGGGGRRGAIIHNPAARGAAASAASPRVKCSFLRTSSAHLLRICSSAARSCTKTT